MENGLALTFMVIIGRKRDFTMVRRDV